MIIKTDEFKRVCSTVLSAIDGNELNTITTSLELKTEGYVLLLNVTNGEYYTTVKFQLDHEEDFHAVVNANLFLKLVSQVTSSDIELTCSSNYLNMKADGSYKIPLVFENDSLINLPTIEINNPTVEMNISKSVLDSILLVNSKELLKTDSIASDLQRLYYIDQAGCITFTLGACVNDFVLEKPVKLLLTDKIVKLFRLFKQDSVKFVLGYDAVSDTLTQTKVSFINDDIKITAITTCNDNLLSKVPVSAIRDLTNKTYDYSVVVSTQSLLQSINRLLLFTNKKEQQEAYGSVVIDGTHFTLTTVGENKEAVKLESSTLGTNSYTLSINLFDLKVILEACKEEYITVSFGDHRAVVLSRGSVKNLVPEIVVD